MMSNKKLAALKALFDKEQQEKSGSKGKHNGDIYPFWEMGLNEKAVVRILPDKNLENPYMFFIDKLEHKLSINGVVEKVPCLQMYGEKCPICDLSREFYKSEGKGSENGKYYYRKKISLVRLLVIKDPLPPDEETKENAEGKVLNTQFGYQLMEKIKEEIRGEELDSLPWEFEDGYDFIIKKTPQGEYGTYAVGSGFARKSTSIDADLIDSIELIDLETLLPENPGYERVKRKLDAHLNGSEDTEETEETEETEDTEETVNSDAVEVVKKSEKVVGEKKAPAVSTSSKATTDDDDDDDDDILAQIRRNRKK